jgi:hypothetical protein
MGRDSAVTTVVVVLDGRSDSTSTRVVETTVVEVDVVDVLATVPGEEELPQATRSDPTITNGRRRPASRPVVTGNRTLGTPPN